MTTICGEFWRTPYVLLAVFGSCCSGGWRTRRGGERGGGDRDGVDGVRN